MTTTDTNSGGHLEFQDWGAAQDYFFDNGLTDGLPIVPPTPEGPGNAGYLAFPLTMTWEPK